MSNHAAPINRHGKAGSASSKTMAGTATALPMVEVPMTHAGLRKHIATWRGRVTVSYHVERLRVEIDLPGVCERWVLHASPLGAIRAAQAFDAPLWPR